MLLKKEAKIFLLIGSFLIAMYSFLKPQPSFGFMTHGLAYEIAAVMGSYLGGIIAVAMFIVIGINLIQEIKMSRTKKKAITK